MQFSLYVELNIKGVMWSHLLCEGASASGATAPRRIGVAYRVRELIDPEGWAGSYEAMLTSAPSPAGDFSGP